MKTEQLKLIAGIFYPIDKITATNTGVFIHIYDKVQGKWDWLQFDPETNPGQTLEVLKWLRKQYNDFAIFADEEGWVIRLPMDIKNDWIEDKDFPTAVCMAAFELIQMKNEDKV